MRRRSGGSSSEQSGDGFSSVSKMSAGNRYILGNMRYLRLAIAVLLILLIFALFCCISSFITNIIDLQTDLTTSVKLVEEEEMLDGDGEDGEGDPEPTCSDGNVCTADYERDIGGCESIPLPELTPCNDLCLGGDGQCKYIELQKGIFKPICVGSCRGECTTEVDCLDLVPAQVQCSPECPETGGDPGTKCYPPPVFQKFCRSGMCFWKHELPVGESLGGESFDDAIAVEDIPEFGCRENEWFKSYCMGLISDDDTRKHCLVPVVDCVTRVVNATGGSGPEEVRMPDCVYHYWCAEERLDSFFT